MKIIKIGLSPLGMRKVMTKGNNTKLDDEFVECLWNYVMFTKNINRTYIECPYCNIDHHFGKKYDFYNNSELIYSYKDALIKVGNGMMFIVSEDGKKLYEVPDIYFHFFASHNYVPTDTFKEAVMYGIKPGNSEYYKYIKNYFLNKKEKILIKDKRLVVNGIVCNTCKREMQGGIAYRISNKYNDKLSSHIIYTDSDEKEVKYKYICYVCGHYV